MLAEADGEGALGDGEAADDESAVEADEVGFSPHATTSSNMHAATTDRITGQW